MTKNKISARQYPATLHKRALKLGEQSIRSFILRKDRIVIFCCLPVHNHGAIVQINSR